MIERKPLPLWFGLYVGFVVTMLFLIGYQSVGDTTARGWLATLALALELWGVLLIASPELRPIVERAAAATWQMLRSFGASIWLRIRRLLRIRRHYSLNAESASYITAGGDISTEGGRAPPPSSATLDEKVEYLLEQGERHRTLINKLEDRLQEETDAIRAELAGTVAELREHTSISVREAAEAELNSRLLGVGFVMAGIVFAYAASVS